MDKEVLSIVREYKKELEARGIKVKRILLFGSYAKGEAEKDSDIDLLIISDDFKNMDLWERLTFLGRARAKIKKPMEILGYTEEELAQQDKASFLYNEVIEKGIEIKE